MVNLNRRQFMASSTALGLGGGSFAGTLSGLHAAQAADTSGYKALVCIFLLGGMDHADTVLPYDTPSYNALANIRPEQFNAHGVGSGSSSRDRSNLLQLTTPNANQFGSRRYALTQQMQGLKSMYDDGDMAIMGSVGPLITNVTREDLESDDAIVPQNLFSHNDQQSMWQTFGPEGTTFGWGGLFLDQVLRSDPATDPRYSLITTAQNATFLSGQDANSFTVSPFGDLGLDIINRRYIVGSNSIFDPTRADMNQYFERRNFAANNVFQRDFGNLQGMNVAAANDFADLFNNAPSPIEFPATNLGQQLNAISRIINLNGDLNSNRQIFYAAIGGFDTHDGQAQQLPNLHSQINDAMVAFRQAMIEVDMWNDVTVFTASDFGRTLGDNGDGTDHGWGGHHFIAGGSVRGGQIYGTMPTSDLEGEEYTPSRGRLIPSTSVDQFAATLGNWFGLSNSELNNVLPNLNNFNTRDIGFMDTGQTQQVASIRVQIPSTRDETRAVPSPVTQEQTFQLTEQEATSIDISTQKLRGRRQRAGERRLFFQDPDTN